MDDSTTTICILLDTIIPDLSKCDGKDLTNLATSNPQLILNFDSTYSLCLWGQNVGGVNVLLSKAMSEVRNKKLGNFKINFSKSYVMPESVQVTVEVIAQIVRAFQIVNTIINILKEKTSIFLEIPTSIKSLPDITNLILSALPKSTMDPPTNMSITRPSVISYTTPNSFNSTHQEFTTNFMSPNHVQSSMPQLLPCYINEQSLATDSNLTMYSIPQQPQSFGNFHDLLSSNSQPRNLMQNTQLTPATNTSLFVFNNINNTVKPFSTTTTLPPKDYLEKTLSINFMNQTMTTGNYNLTSLVTTTLSGMSSNIVSRNIATETAIATDLSVTDKNNQQFDNEESFDDFIAKLQERIFVENKSPTTTNPIPLNSTTTISTIAQTTTTTMAAFTPNIFQPLDIEIKQEKDDGPSNSNPLSISTNSDTTNTFDISPFTSISTSSMPNLQQPPASLFSTSNTILNGITTQSDVCDSLPGPSGVVVTKRESTDDLLFSKTSTIEGEPTEMNDLPAEILEKMNVFDRDQYDNGSSSDLSGSRIYNRSKSNLLDGKGGICNFLLSKEAIPVSESPLQQEEQQTGSPSSSLDGRSGLAQSDSQTNSIGNDDEEESNDSDSSVGNTSSEFLARRRMKRRGEDISASIGANTDDLYKDPADVPRKLPPPVVKKNALDEMFDQLSEKPKDVQKDPCSAIIRNMLAHQKMALNWMIERENTKELPPFWECIRLNKDYFNTATRKRLKERPASVLGGILADDMGLGKTLTTIALILTNHKDGKPMFTRKRSLPTQASEIAAESTKIIIKREKDGYKATPKTDLSKPESKFRQIYLEQVSKKKKKKKKKFPSSVEKKEKDAMFSDSDSDSGLKVNKTINSLLKSPIVKTDDHGTKRSKSPVGMFGQPATDRKMTLIVCPMSVLSNWTDQFNEHVSPSINIRIYVYYGQKRERDVSFLCTHDVIISTYGIVSADYRASNKINGKPSPLHKINWFRVVLDEGHTIRNSRSQINQALINLDSERRWLLTGTPIQNRMTDLWSMLNFLRLEPFTNRRWWSRFVVASMKRQPRRGELVYNRVQKIIKHIAIRRLKTDCIDGKPIVNLPDRQVVTHSVKFNDDERKLYDAMHKDGKLVVCKYIRQGTVMKNYANVLVIIMRLRQLCCHPNLCIKAVRRLKKALDVMEQLQGNMQQVENTGEEGILGEEENGIELKDDDREKLIQQLMQLITSGDSEECSICLENLDDPVITKCAHVFCSNCINEVIENTERPPVCPLCRSDIDQGSMVKVPGKLKEKEINPALENGDSTQNGIEGQEDDDDGEQWISSSKKMSEDRVRVALQQSNAKVCGSGAVIQKGRPLPSLAAALKKEENREKLSLRQKLRQKIKRQELQRAGLLYSVNNDAVIEKAIKAATTPLRKPPVKKEKSQKTLRRSMRKKNKVCPEIDVPTPSCWTPNVEEDYAKEDASHKQTGRGNTNNKLVDVSDKGRQDITAIPSPINAGNNETDSREPIAPPVKVPTLINTIENELVSHKEPQAHVLVMGEDGTAQQRVKIDGFSTGCSDFKRVICDLLMRLFGCISVQPDSGDKKPTLLQYFRRKKKEVKKLEKRQKLKNGKKECVSSDPPVLVTFKHESDRSLDILVTSPALDPQNTKKAKISKIIPKRLFQDIDKKVNAAKLKKFLPPLRRSRRICDPVIRVRKPTGVSFDIDVQTETSKSTTCGRPGTPFVRCGTPSSNLRRENLTLEQLQLKQVLAEEKRLALVRNRTRPVSARRERVGVQKLNLEQLEQERKNALRAYELKKEERAEFLKKKSEEERLKKIAEKRMRRERARKLKVRCEELVELKKEKEAECNTENLKPPNNRKDDQISSLIQRLHDRNTEIAIKSLDSRKLKDDLNDEECCMTEVDRLAFSSQQPRNEDEPLIVSLLESFELNDAGINGSFDIADAGIDGSLDVADPGIDGSLGVTDARIDGNMEISEAGINETLEIADAGFDEKLVVADLGINGSLDIADAGIDGSLEIADAGFDGSLDVADTGIDESFDVADAGIDESFDIADTGIDESFNVADAGIDGSFDVADAGIDGSFDVADAGIDESFDVADAGIDESFFDIADTGIDESFDFADAGIDQSFDLADAGIDGSLNAEKNGERVPSTEDIDSNGEFEIDEAFYDVVDALMKCLNELRSDDNSLKSLVVSQFTSFLDILEKLLKKDGFNYVRLDGTMSQPARACVIDKFQKDDDHSPTIMLLSLTAGGVGLNLTAANRVYLMDPAWNPAIEEQCFDRAHRLGQKKDVKIIKFIVENSVEERMLILQKQKKELMDKAFGIPQRQTGKQRRNAALKDIATLLNINISKINPPAV